MSRKLRVYLAVPFICKSPLVPQGHDRGHRSWALALRMKACPVKPPTAAVKATKLPTSELVDSDISPEGRCGTIDLGRTVIRLRWTSSQEH
jgi:hypothetical protein